MSVLNIFGNYQKEGPGVSKEQREKKPFFKFWEIFGRKFWSLIFLNLIFIMCLIPLGGLSFLILTLLRASDAWSVQSNVIMSFIVSGTPFMLCGPLVSAMQKITRDFSREEPVFVWTDFFACIRKNFAKPLVMSIISYIVFSCLTVAIPFYYYSDFGAIRYLFFGLSIFILVFFLFMQYYLFAMAVTFDLSLKEMYKNAAIITTVTIVKNIIITAILVLYLAVTLFAFLFTPVFNFFFPIILLFFLLFGFAMFSMIVSFITFPALKKYIIDPYYNELEEESDTDDETEIDPELELLRQSKSEYVYLNGRMVHRSAIEGEQVFNDERKL